MIEQEVVYERNLTGSYMKIIAAECSEFDERMLFSHRIRGILPVEQCYLNGEAWYWYNISGKQSLDTYCRIQEIGISFIEKIILSICDEIAILEWRLFDLNCLLLAPEYIYINNLNQEIIFTLYPGGKEDLSVQFRELMEYLLTVIDHKDVQAVQAAYGIYEKTLDEAYGIMDIRDYILQERKQKTQEDLPKSLTPEGKSLYGDAGQTVNTPMPEIQGGLKVEEDHTAYGSHTVFSEIMKILNGWKDSLLKRSSRQTSYQEPMYGQRKKTGSLPPIMENPQQMTMAPEMEESMQTTCLDDYGGFVQGLLVYEGGEGFENLRLPQDHAVVGKARSAQLRIPKNTISQHHAKISYREQAYYLEDLNSTNGTYVNEEALAYKESRKLKINDRIRFADVSYRFL